MEYELIRHAGGTALKTFVVDINQRELHFHGDLELCYILEGSVVIDDGAKRHKAVCGDIFLSNRNAVHSLKKTDEPNLLMVLQFDPNICKEYYPKIALVKFEKRHLKPEIDKVYHGALVDCMKSIVALLCGKSEGYQIEVMSKLHHMIYVMLKNDPYSVIDEKSAVSERRNITRLKRIVDYIGENYMYPITLKEIASRENLNMYYLSHFIKEQLGISFQNYLSRIRAERAEYLLLHTDLSHIDICMECGFSDYKYLNKTFEKEYGMPLAEYRIRKKEKRRREEEQSDQHRVMDISNALEYF